MKKIVYIFLFSLLLTLTFAENSSAQCAMCSVNAEQSVKNGNTQGKGLNSGILYLLAFPYALISGLGILWYVRYRRKVTNYAGNV